MLKDKDVVDIHDYMFPSIVLVVIATVFTTVARFSVTGTTVLTNVGDVLGASAVGVMAAFLIAKRMWRAWLGIFLMLLAVDALIIFTWGLPTLSYHSLAPTIPVLIWGMNKLTRRWLNKRRGSSAG